MQGVELEQTSVQLGEAREYQWPIGRQTPAHWPRVVGGASGPVSLPCLLTKAFLYTLWNLSFTHLIVASDARALGIVNL